MNDVTREELKQDGFSPELVNQCIGEMLVDKRQEELRSIQQFAQTGMNKAIAKKGEVRKPIRNFQDIIADLAIARERATGQDSAVAKKILETIGEIENYCSQQQQSFLKADANAQASCEPVCEVQASCEMNTIFSPESLIEKQNNNIINVLNTAKSSEQFLAHKSEKSELKDKPNPVEVAQRLMRRYVFALYKESVYLFVQSYYRLCSKSEICRIINESCRAEVHASGHSSFLREIYEFIFNELGIVKYEGSFDEITHLVCFRNGYLDLKRGIFSSPDPKFFFTHCIDVDYDLNDRCDCPNFRQFLHDISSGDLYLEKRIWEVMGYIFSNNSYQKFIFIFQGVPNSGKSALAAFISSFFPEEARTSISIDEFDSNFALGNLHGKAICLDLDLSAGKISDKVVGRLKRLTGNDVITADVKYRERVKFRNRAKFLYATNHPFETITYDHGLQQRLIVVPFTNSVSKEVYNINLLSLFEQERLAIVKIALQQYCQLAANKFVFSGSYELNAITRSCDNNPVLMVTALDLIQEFVGDCCEMTVQTVYSFTVDLFNAFVAYYENRSIKLLDLKQFSEVLNSRYKEYVLRGRKRRTPKSNPESVFLGIKLKGGVDFAE